MSDRYTFWHTICQVIFALLDIQAKVRISSLWAGFEPAQGNPIGFRVQRLNHSAITAIINSSTFKIHADPQTCWITDYINVIFDQNSPSRACLALKTLKSLQVRWAAVFRTPGNNPLHFRCINITNKTITNWQIKEAQCIPIIYTRLKLMQVEKQWIYLCPFCFYSM